MIRIDRKRFDAAPFQINFEIATRFDDVDMLGHINNAASVVFLQEARAHFIQTVGDAAQRGDLRPMVAALYVEYAGEMHYPTLVSIGSGLVAIGRTSFTLGQVARVDGDSRLYSQAVMVLADASGPVVIPAGLRAAYEQLMIPA